VSAGPVALVGSGEYLPVMAEVEALLLDGRQPRYVQIPTAAAQEGPASLTHWVELGKQQAQRLGVEAVPVVARTREEADDPELAALVDGAGLVYLSGGSPPYLSSTLRGTRLWEAVLAAWQGGAALAGCSAGAMAMTDWTPHVRALEEPPEPGLGVVPGVWVIPHFDRMNEWEPELLPRVEAVLPEDVALLGIDEETALMRLDDRWVVHGRQKVWVLGAEHRAYGAGEVVPLSPSAS
jgi:cyanophycinase